MSRKNRPIGKIRGAWFANTRPPNIPYVKQPAGSASRAGQIYEQKFVEFLQAKLPWWQCYAEPWLRFEDDEGMTWCAPDALAVFPKLIIIFECKLRFRPWGVRAKQRKLYRPCIEMIWPDTEVRSIQVCRHLNPSIKGVGLIKTLDQSWSPVVRWSYRILNWVPDF